MLFQALEAFNVVRILQPLLDGGGYIIDPRDNKIKPAIESVDWKSPWVYVNPGAEMGVCRFNTHLFNTLNIVPKFCRECYKVTFRVGTVFQLVKMLEMMRKEFLPRGWNCKCGFEVREWVAASYGGYLYNRGLRQAKERYLEAKELAEKWLTLSPATIEQLRTVGYVFDPTPKVVLKRACTEMEMTFGPSDKWEFPVEWDHVENHISQYVQVGLAKQNPPTPQYLIEAKIAEWLKKAHGRGDPTAAMFNEGNPIYKTQVVTYHEDLLKPKEALDAQDR